MSLASLPGGMLVPIGPGFNHTFSSPTSLNSTLLDATNEACILIGEVVTSDGGSHTLDTTGSSSLQWVTGTVTFANAGTTVKVGLAPVDAGNGPAPRASNASDVVSFDVSKSLTGGGGGITSSALQSHVPDTGTKTVANGDLVAFAIQMTARAGADTINVNTPAVSVSTLRPSVTGFTGGAYAAVTCVPNAIIVFSDGAIGYFFASEVCLSLNTRTWNSGSATTEYGQLFNLPFPVKIFGAYLWAAASADFDVVLYSDPLGTPVAEKTRSIDANTVTTASARRFATMFSSPYTTTAGQNIGIVLKPGASNVSGYYKTLGNSAHRIADPWGTSGYGISRASGAFANANSSLDHYYIGLIASAFDAGGGGGLAANPLGGFVG